MRYPRVLADALRRGDLTPETFVVVTYMIAKSDRHTGEWDGSLDALAEATRWPHGTEQLRRQLHHLVALCVCNVSRGSRYRPWVVSFPWLAAPPSAHRNSTSSPPLYHPQPTAPVVHEWTGGGADPQESSGDDAFAGGEGGGAVVDGYGDRNRDLRVSLPAPRPRAAYRSSRTADEGPQYPRGTEPE